MLGRDTEPPTFSQSLHLVALVFPSWESWSTREIALTGFEMVLVLRGANFWDTPTTLTYSWPTVLGSFSYPWKAWTGGKKRETDQLDGTATLAALLLKHNNLTDTNQRWYCSHLDFSEYLTCLTLGGGCFRAQFWDLPFHSLLIMHFFLLIKLVDSDGRCRENTGHIMRIIIVSQGITETKRQSLFSSKQF